MAVIRPTPFGVRSTNDTDAGQGNILIADGTFEITSNNDAVQAYGTLEIDGGAFNITTGGGYSQNTTVRKDNGPGGMGGAPGGKGNSAPQAAKVPFDPSLMIRSHTESS